MSPWHRWGRMAQGAVALATALPLLVTGLPATAHAAIYSADSRDVQLQNGDQILGDLHVDGTLTVPSGVTVPVRATSTVTISAAHIVIVGTLDGIGGGGPGGPGAGGAGQSAQDACGGGAGGSSAGLGGAGGLGGTAPADARGGLAGPAYPAGPGSGGGAGGACGTDAGAPGGQGGAGIHLSSPDIRISGAVRVDGERGASDLADGSGLSGGGGGGGSGGEIVLSGTTVLSGTLSAQGGSGGGASGRGAGGGGGGSGGRITVEGGPLIGEGSWSIMANQATVAVGGTAGPNAQPGSPGGKGVVPEITAPTSTATTVSSSLNPSGVGQTVVFTATVTPGDATGSVSFDADGTVISGCDAVPVVSGSASCAASELAAGDHAIAATFTPDTALYVLSVGSLRPPQTVQQALLPQSITFPSLADHLVGEAPFTLTGVVGGDSGNPVTFTSSGPCTVTSATVTLTGVGTCAVIANQAGGNGYLPAPSVQRDFAIGYGQQVVSLSASGRRGGFVAVVLRLVDATGHNLSSTAVPVHATAIDSGPLSLVFAGDASSDFQYQPFLRSYTFGALVRTGLARGAHTLTFVAGQDPRPHTITFTTY